MGSIGNPPSNLSLKWCIERFVEHSRSPVVRVVLGLAHGFAVVPGEFAPLSQRHLPPVPGQLERGLAPCRTRRIVLQALDQVGAEAPSTAQVAPRRHPGHGLQGIIQISDHMLAGAECHAFDRAVKTIEQFGPFARWRTTRDRIHEEVCRHGYSAERRCFVQSYGSREMDAALLMLPLVGFLPASDPRIQRTVPAIEDDLLVDGLVRRYRTEAVTDGLPAGEGAFLACSFW